MELPSVEPEAVYLKKLHNKDRVELEIIPLHQVEDDIECVDQQEEAEQKNKNAEPWRFGQAHAPSYLRVTTPHAYVAKQLNDILQLDVPTMAIHQVVVGENTSHVSTPLLSAQLGLTPLRADASKFRYLHEQEDAKAGMGLQSKRTTSNTIWLNLDVSAPPMDKIPLDDEDLIRHTTFEEFKQLRASAENAGWCSPDGLLKVLGALRGQCVLTELLEKRTRKVYASDITLSGLSASEKSHQDIRPARPRMLLAILKPGERIYAEMLAFKGTGREHGKFMPLCHVGHRQIPTVRIVPDDGKKLTLLEAEAVVTSCPQHVFDIEETTGQLQVVRPLACTHCGACTNMPTKRPRIELGYVPDQFMLTLEPVGQYESVKPIIQTAMDILARKRAEVDKL